MDVADLEQTLGVQFKNTDLLVQALTHRSYINEYEGEDIADNERLEFLGDAVIDLVVADMLYRKYPELPEGDLTRLRAALVRTEGLAQLALECRLGDFLLIGKGEANSGGRTRPTNLCRGFEAVVGALYLDQGMGAVRRLILPRMKRLLKRVWEEGLYRDARSDLQEWSQAELNVTPVYRTITASGPDHDKEFLVEARIGEQVAGRGVGRSKQSAAQAAARAALRYLDRGELHFVLNGSSVSA